jgi:murein L,D-transpeptidase YcbB/YkuD
MDLARLEAAIVRYRAIVDAGGWPTVVSSRNLREGDSGAEVGTIRRRLIIETGPTATLPASLTFDADLTGAIMEFQARHGLDTDGVVGPRTREALNVSAHDRLIQLERNAARLHARSDSAPLPRIEVNIAAQVLRYYDETGDVLEMRVIVGRRDWPTPVFNSSLTAVTFAPYWNVPTRIASLEVIPAVRRDPSYLRRNDMEILDASGQVVNPSSIDWANLRAGEFPHRIRQRPGPANPLGDVKFFLPNPFDVYLHDTPGREAFARADRALSHGCVRLERALDLAMAILRGRPEAQPDTINAIIRSGRERVTRLATPIPVTLRYMTAWVDPDGTVQFRRDIYGRDSRIDVLAGTGASDCSVEAQKSTV